MVRVSDELWDKAQRQAQQQGETISEVIRQALARYATPKKRRRLTMRLTPDVPPSQGIRTLSTALALACGARPEEAEAVVDHLGDARVPPSAEEAVDAIRRAIDEVRR